MFSTVGDAAPWVPFPPLNRTDADVHLIYVAGNSILYENPVEDPVFSAHIVSNRSSTDDDANFESDYYLGVIACAEQHQICHGDICTSLDSITPTFASLAGLSAIADLSAIQRTIFQRIGFASVFTGITQVINGRSGSALRASETVLGISQASLPADQWQIEVSSWFSTGLAMLQHTLQEFVSPGNLRQGISITEFQTPVEKAMCLSQKTQTTRGTISFSVLGLAIIVIVGALVILTSLVLETIASWVGSKTYASWRMDDTLQLQRMVFETRGVSWTNIEGTVPVTVAAEKFPSVGRSPESQALMTGHEKTMGVTVEEIR